MYYIHNSVSINKVFNSDEVKENLGKFTNKLDKGSLVTSYDGRVICTVDVSKVYYNFDFSNFSKNIVSEIEKYFTPEKYALKAQSGVQELKLVGDGVYIDNERYEKMVSIVNSTDKSRALSMNIGLVKIDKFGRVQSCTILTSFSNKHYKSSLPDKIKSFSDNLINFDMDIDFHVQTIEDLKHKEISIVEFTKTILFNKDGKVIKSVELKLNAMGKRLAYNYGFRDKYSTVTNLTSANLDNVKDFTINAKTLYSAYIELFKGCDTSIIARESRRIIDTLDTF